MYEKRKGFCLIDGPLNHFNSFRPTVLVLLYSIYILVLLVRHT